jgi:hypothetical protein
VATSDGGTADQPFVVGALYRARIVALRRGLKAYEAATRAHDKATTAMTPDRTALLAAKVAAGKDLARARDALDAALLGGS